MAIPFILLENKLKVELVPTNAICEIEKLPNKKAMKQISWLLIQIFIMVYSAN